MSIELIHGDCLEIMKGFEDGQFDAVVTDPPYGTKTNQREAWMIGEFSNVMPLALPLIYNVSKSDAAFYCFTSWSMMADWLLRYQQYFKLQNILVWDKRRHSGCWTANSWQFTWEGIFFGIKGSRKIRKYMPDILHSGEHRPAFPMQKPVDVIVQLIEASTDSGDTILDPFMGSGTTLVACVKTGRNGVGIEIDEGYYDIAVKRVREAEMQPRLM